MCSKRRATLSWRLGFVAFELLLEQARRRLGWRERVELAPEVVGATRREEVQSPGFDGSGKGAAGSVRVSELELQNRPEETSGTVGWVELDSSARRGQRLTRASELALGQGQTEVGLGGFRGSLDSLSKRSSRLLVASRFGPSLAGIHIDQGWPIARGKRGGEVPLGLLSPAARKGDGSA